MSQQINLFNPIFLKQKKIFAALPMVQTLGVIIVGSLLLNWYSGQRVAELERTANAGKAVLAAREQMLARANTEFAPRPKNPTLEAELADAQVQLKALHDVESVLHGGALGNTAGYAEYFRAFSRQNINGLWLTGVSINGAGNDIGLQGRAMQPTMIPNYIARLTGERIMHGKTFASLDIARPDAQVMPAAPVAAAPVVAAATVPAASGATAASTVAAAPPAPASAVPAGPVASPFVEFNLQSTMQEGAK